MSAAPHIQPFSRRGVCPALSAPMQTGDGLLSRIALEGDVSPEALVQLCELAIRHGNGLVDITARGSLQFRGLTAESATQLERDVIALDLPLRQGLAVECSPLAGHDPFEISDPSGIVSQIRDKAASSGLHEKLAAKMSVVIDGGGQVRLGDLVADIRLKAVPVSGEVLWLLMLGGTEDKALRAGLVTAENAADAVIALLLHLAKIGDGARGRDLNLAAVKAVCRELLIDGLGDDTAVASEPSLGLLLLDENLFAACCAPAFGQVSATVLGDVCRHAMALGIASFRFGPSHSLLAFGSDLVCRGLLEFAQVQGFVTQAGDPRSAIAVCPGSPACASAFAPVQELAAYAAEKCGTLLDGSFTLHLSGCGKGCAHPSPALLSFAGTADGLTFGYSARVSATPDVILPFTQQKAALSRLARLYEKEHKPGENARTLLVRLGKARVIEALRQDER